MRPPTLSKSSFSRLCINYKNNVPPGQCREARLGVLGWLWRIAYGDPSRSASIACSSRFRRLSLSSSGLARVTNSTYSWNQRW